MTTESGGGHPPPLLSVAASAEPAQGRELSHEAKGRRPGYGKRALERNRKRRVIFARPRRRRRAERRGLRQRPGRDQLQVRHDGLGKGDLAESGRDGHGELGQVLRGRRQPDEVRGLLETRRAEGERATTRTGRYVLGLTQMVSVSGLPARLVSSIASVPSTVCRPATVRAPQETATCSAAATVVGSELAEVLVPGSPSRNSTGKPAATAPQSRVAKGVPSALRPAGHSCLSRPGFCRVADQGIAGRRAEALVVGRMPGRGIRDRAPLAAV